MNDEKKASCNAGDLIEEARRYGEMMRSDSPNVPASWALLQKLANALEASLSSREAVLEEAARACDAIQDKTDKWGPMAAYCAEQIRALKVGQVDDAYQGEGGV